MSGIFLTKEFWVVVAGLVTLLGSVYAHFLSKKAKKDRDQKAADESGAKGEEVQQVETAPEVKKINEQIKVQAMAEEVFFRDTPLDPAIWYECCVAAYNTQLDHSLVAAIVLAESNGSPFAMRFEPEWKYGFKHEEFAKKLGSSVATEKITQATSWGLMQVMGTVAREYGFIGWLSELCEIKQGLKYGTMHLKAKIAKYGLPGGISAYNAGSPAKTEKGLYVNQAYVDRIVEYQKRFLDVTKPPIG